MAVSCHFLCVRLHWATPRHATETWLGCKAVACWASQDRCVAAMPSQWRQIILYFWDLLAAACWLLPAGFTAARPAA
jgi:hypothetical protein